MQVKKQLDEELEHLNTSFNQLRAAQSKFSDCARSVEGGVKGQEEGTFSLRGKCAVEGSVEGGGGMGLRWDDGREWGGER